MIHQASFLRGKIKGILPLNFKGDFTSGLKIFINHQIPLQVKRKHGAEKGGLNGRYSYKLQIPSPDRQIPFLLDPGNYFFLDIK